MQIFISSHDPSYDDAARFAVYMGHYPAASSVQAFLHYAQIINHTDMPLFDWGSQALNQQHYGQYTPPSVNFSKITVPTAMFVGSVDEMGDPKDAAQTKSLMNPSTLVHYEMIPGGHATFMVGNDMSYFKTVMDLIKQHQ